MKVQSELMLNLASEKKNVSRISKMWWKKGIDEHSLWRYLQKIYFKLSNKMQLSVPLWKSLEDFLCLPEGLCVNFYMRGNKRKWWTVNRLKNELLANRSVPRSQKCLQLPDTFPRPDIYFQKLNKSRFDDLPLPFLL